MKFNFKDTSKIRVVDDFENLSYLVYKFGGDLMNGQFNVYLDGFKVGLNEAPLLKAGFKDIGGVTNYLLTTAPDDARDYMLVNWNTCFICEMQKVSK